MKFIQLVHDKLLKMPKTSKLLKIDYEEIKGIEADYFVSFRKIDNKAVRIIPNVHAGMRFLDLVDGDVIFYGLQMDSPIYKCILWDIAHALKVGSKLYFFCDNKEQIYLKTKYFADSFRIEVRENYYCATKTRPLPIEENKGMDKWSFGIPVGPEDATFLNTLVETILRFDCKEKEIILCGKPNENFKYFDKVKIVGENITAPPVQISKKKNILFKSAKYDNVCILHDRVLLPCDFINVMKAYGDFYSFTTLQSIYFDDYHNYVPIRYSDYNEICYDNGVTNVKKLNRHKKEVVFCSDTFNIIENCGFAYASPVNYSDRMYATGSLYILKKNIGQIFTLDEGLVWEQFEDVEFGLRLSQCGVITRINPYGFSQSVISRPIILGQYSLVYFDASNKLKVWISKRHNLKLNYKPLYRMTEKKAITLLQRFEKKYCKNVTGITYEKISMRKKLEFIDRLIISSHFVATDDKILQFIKDVEKYVFWGKMGYVSEKDYFDKLKKDKRSGKRELALFYGSIWEAFLRRSGKIFYDEMTDYYVKKSVLVKIGSLFSAMHMKRNEGNIYYNPNGIKGYYKAIINSTPWKG